MDECYTIIGVLRRTKWIPEFAQQSQHEIRALAIAEWEQEKDKFAAKFMSQSINNNILISCEYETQNVDNKERNDVMLALTTTQPGKQLERCSIMSSIEKYVEMAVAWIRLGGDDRWRYQH